MERYYQLPFSKYDPDLQPPRELLRTLNRAYLRSKHWVPIAGNRDKAIILIDDPNDANRIMEIQQVMNARSYEFRVGLREDILRFLGEAVELPTEAGREMKLEDLVGKLGEDDPFQEADIGDVKSRIGENEAAVVQLVNRVIVDATRLNASDIHIEPGKGRESTIIRMRVDGVCREVTRIPASHVRAVVARIKILARL
ncbi:MAG TPA: general secretion pathway protein GspE, partial [Syntrophobacteraceae bacterium]|nr:general secretion pathway protein GspE [Syntrophobacteraceae bacterium]